jgi:hypothetical protein
VLIVLRGPLPSCEVRAQRRIAAKRGANAVRLSKVIRPRRARALPGHYLVTVYVGSLPKVRKLVRISGNRAQLLPAAAVNEALSLCTARSDALTTFVDGPDGASSRAVPPSVGDRLTPVTPVTDGESPAASVLSFLDVDRGDTLNPLLAVVLGIALGALLLAGLGGMAAFLRGRTGSA